MFSKQTQGTEIRNFGQKKDRPSCELHGISGSKIKHAFFNCFIVKRIEVKYSYKTFVLFSEFCHYSAGLMSSPTISVSRSASLSGVRVRPGSCCHSCPALACQPCSPAGQRESLEQQRSQGWVEPGSRPTTQPPARPLQNTVTVWRAALDLPGTRQVVVEPVLAPVLPVGGAVTVGAGQPVEAGQAGLAGQAGAGQLQHAALCTGSQQSWYTYIRLTDKSEYLHAEGEQLLPVLRLPLPRPGYLLF